MNRTWRILTAIFSAGVLAAAGYELVLVSFHFDLREEYALEDGILTGHPHWRLFQNRVLAPCIFGVIRKATGWQTSTAYKATFMLLLSLFYLTLACCLWNLTKTPRTVAFGLLAAFALNAILLINPSWIYLWDLVDLTIFSLLVWALLSSQRVWVLALIIAVEIFNREIALILASLLLVDGFLRRGVLGAQQARRQMILGAALAIGGLIIIEGLRHTLLVAEVGPARWHIKSGPFFNIQILWNIWDLFPPQMSVRLNQQGKVMTIGKENMLPQYGTLLAFAVWIVYQAVRGVSTKRRAALWFAILFAAVLVFGIAVEWRVWLVFVPYVILTLAISNKSPLVNSHYDSN
jgi:hypothetical protein